MLLHRAVNCLCTAKQPGTVISVSHSSLSLPGMLPHPRLFWYSGTPQCWGRYLESHSQRCCRLLFGWCQSKPELSVPSTGKNSTRMHQVSLAQPGLKAPGLVRALSVTQSSPHPACTLQHCGQERKTAQTCSGGNSTAFHANNSLSCLQKYCLFWQQLWN